MSTRRAFVILACLVVSLPAWGQVSFPKTGYYVAMGDSFVAGQGAIPMTRGYAYQLYDRGVFGSTTATYFANLGVKGAGSWDLKLHQVPMVICAATSSRPKIITITTGGNDTGSVTPIVQRIADAVDILFHNDDLGDPVTYPGTSTPCPALSNVTIMVSNYYHITGLETRLIAFSNALESALNTITVPEGSHLVFVDLYTPSLERTGLVLAERDPGGGFNIHPTNAGHTFIAKQFEEAWEELQE